MDLSTLERKLIEMERFIELDDTANYNMLTTLYFEVKELFVYCYDNPTINDKEVNMLNRKFKIMNAEWNNPDSDHDDTLDMMFPNRENDIYDIDDFFEGN